MKNQRNSCNNRENISKIQQVVHKSKHFTLKISLLLLEIQFATELLMTKIEPFENVIQYSILHKLL